MTLNADTGVDYAMQILAEEKQVSRSGKNKWVAVRRDNHLLDCENYAAACADPEWAPSLTFIAGRMSEKQSDRPRQKQKQIQPKAGNEGRRTRPSWLNNR